MLDQTLASHSIKFDLEIHLMLGQVYLCSFVNGLFNSLLIISWLMSKESDKMKSNKSVTYSWEWDTFFPNGG